MMKRTRVPYHIPPVILFLCACAVIFTFVVHAQHQEQRGDDFDHLNPSYALGDPLSPPEDAAGDDHALPPTPPTMAPAPPEDADGGDHALPPTPPMMTAVGEDIARAGQASLRELHEKAVRDISDPHYHCNTTGCRLSHKYRHINRRYPWQRTPEDNAKMEDVINKDEHNEQQSSAAGNNLWDRVFTPIDNRDCSQHDATSTTPANTTKPAKAVTGKRIFVQIDDCLDEANPLCLYELLWDPISSLWFFCKDSEEDDCFGISLTTPPSDHPQVIAEGDDDDDNDDDDSDNDNDGDHPITNNVSNVAANKTDTIIDEMDDAKKHAHMGDSSSSSPNHPTDSQPQQNQQAASIDTINKLHDDATHHFDHDSSAATTPEVPPHTEYYAEGRAISLDDL